jgi:hypothetical protein
MIKLVDILKQMLLEEKKKADRCLRIARRKNKKSSAYRSGQIVRCRQGDIWKDIKENKEEFQNRALDKINKAGGFNNLPDIDKLALLGGSDDAQLKNLSLSKIFKENGGTFGKLEIKIKVKDKNNQPVEHKFSQEFAGKEGYLFPYINYDDDDNQPYVIVRFDEFASDPNLKGGGNYKELPIMLGNMYPIDYDKIKSDFVQYQNKVDFERNEFLKSFGLDDLDEGESLRSWFKRKGPKGKEGGWVDCNTCKDGSCKACGRKKGEKRAKYPSCRPTPAQCKTKGKGKKWGKTK